MLLLSGPALAGYLNVYVLRTLPFALLKGSYASSGGALALVSLCLRKDMLSVLSHIYCPSSFLDMVRLKGSSYRLELYRSWLNTNTGTSDITFAEWASISRPALRILAFDCQKYKPVLFSAQHTPDMLVADALTAATSWPSIGDCHEIDSTLYCDIEFVIAPGLLADFLNPPPLITFEGTMNSMANACQQKKNLHRWCAMFEMYGMSLAQYPCRGLIYRSRGPHILDTFLKSSQKAISSYLQQHNDAPLLLPIVLLAAVTAQVQWQFRT
jgi:hypothetical protein